MTNGLPLAGVRVLDFCEIWLGPVLCSLLGDLGAEVWKIETVTHFSANRGLGVRTTGPAPMYPDQEPGERPWNRCSYYNVHNRSKLGFTLDIAKPQGRDLFLRLVSICDVVVENHSVGMLDKLRIGYSELRRMRPDIILASLSPYGQTGPYRTHTTYGFNIDATCGHASLRGYPDDPLSETDPAYPEDPGGVHVGMFAVAAALHHRSKTGQGQWIDMSQAEAYMDRLGEHFLDYSMNHRVAPRTGNAHPAHAPHGVYRCKGEDRWVAIAVLSEEEWRRFRQALGNPAWTAAPEFVDARSRVAHREALDAQVSAWVAEREDYEVMRILQRHRVRCGVVADAGQLFRDPHLRARGYFERVPHPDAGTHEYPGRGWKFSGADLRITRPANTLGEHNDLIFRELLGLPAAEIGALERQHLIGTEYLPHVVH